MHTEEPAKLVLGERWSSALSALEYLDQGYSLFDQQLRLVACNRRFIELLEFPEELAREGTPFADFVRYNTQRGEYGPGDPDAQFKERIRLAQTFQPHCFERTRPNGRVLEIRGNPIENLGFITVYTDITERKHAEAALRESRDQLEARVEERTAELRALNQQLRAEMASHKHTAAALHDSEQWMRLIADALPTLIAYIDAEQRYGFANKRHQEWFGTDPKNIIGQSLEQAIGSSHHRRLRPHLLEALGGKEIMADQEVICETGKTLNVLFSFIPHFDEQGSVLGCFILGQDLTEHKQTQAALNRAKKMEAIGQLTGGIAHDFNNLLTIIMGNLCFLEEELSTNPELQKTAQTALNAARNGAELIGRLLAFSRQQTLQPRVLSPYWQAAEMGELLRRTLGATIEVSTIVDHSVWNIMVDPNQLTHALINLAINARDAMPQGGKLTISASNAVVEQTDLAQHPDLNPGEYVVVSVTDTGTGMAAEVVEHVFEPFYTTKKSGTGTGLGLSMVYGFVRQSGGHVQILSELGRGTTVKLYLPKAHTSRSQPSSPLARRHSSPQGNQTVLLVEDDPHVRALINRLLTGLGYRVLEASDGSSALAMLRREDATIDLLLTDLYIGNGINGYDLAREAKSQRPDIKVLCVSGYPNKAHNSRETIDFPLLRKPFLKQELAKAVNNALKHD